MGNSWAAINQRLSKVRSAKLGFKPRSSLSLVSSSAAPAKPCPFQKRLPSYKGPQPGQGIQWVRRTNKTITSPPKVSDVYLLSHTVQQHLHLLAFSGWEGTYPSWYFPEVVARGAPSKWIHFIFSVVVSSFSFRPCIHMFSSFRCWNISAMNASLAHHTSPARSSASSYLSSLKNTCISSCNSYTQASTLPCHNHWTSIWGNKALCSHFVT